MNNFLDNVAARSLNLLPLVRPRLASRFEPLSPVGGFGVAPAFAADTIEGEQHAPLVAAQPLAQTTNARAFESKRTQAHAPQVSDVSQQAGDAAEQVESAPAQALRSARAQTSVQPIKIERAHAQTPTTATGETQIQASAVAHDAQQVDNATRGVVEHESEFNLDSRIRRIMAGQLDAQRERLTPPMQPLREPPPMSRAEARELPSRAPTIRITIGRIEVRAVTSSAPAERRAPARPKPMLSLEDYLQQRNGGRR